MRAIKFMLVIVPVFITFLALTAGAAGATHDAGSDNLRAVRGATIRYQSLSVADQHGYALLKDKDGIACIANPGVGTMGIHYVNGDLVGSGQVKATQPQALVYEPEANGQLRLVAVEYVVFQVQWDATHTTRPTLFGQRFMLTPAGNRYDLPAFYSLHAWIWQDNPDGLFAMWNPSVHCTSGAGA
jgi:hypothetical protein